MIKPFGMDFANYLLDKFGYNVFIFMGIASSVFLLVVCIFIRSEYKKLHKTDIKGL